MQIGDDTDDLAILVFVAPGTDAAAQWIIASEHLLGHGFADDDHRRRLERVALRKIAPRDERVPSVAKYPGWITLHCACVSRPAGGSGCPSVRNTRPR